MTTDEQSRELKHRVEAKRHELQAELEKLRADSAKAQGEAAENLKARIKEIDDTLSEGWENLREDAMDRINNWLEKEDRNS